MPISLIADELWHYDRSAPIHVKTVSMTAALTRLHQNQLTAGPFAVSRAGRPSRASKSPIRTVIHLRITAPPQRWPTPRGKAIAIVRSGGGESQAAITGMGLLELAEILNRMTCNAASRPPKSAPLTSALGRNRSTLLGCWKPIAAISLANGEKATEFGCLVKWFHGSVIYWESSMLPNPEALAPASPKHWRFLLRGVATKP